MGLGNYNFIHTIKDHINILWLNTWPAIGGAERAQITFFRQVAKKHCFFAGLQMNPTNQLVDELSAFCSKVFRLPLVRLNQSANPIRLAKLFYHLWTVARRLNRIVKDEGIDIVHVSNINDVPFAALAIWGTKARLVWMIENPERFNFINVAILNLSRIDGLIGTSNAILSQAVSNGVKSKYTTTIQNPYDDRFFFRDATAFGSNHENTIRIGFAGVLCDRKGVLELCKAFQVLSMRLRSNHEGNLRVLLLLAGQGEPEYVSQLKRVSETVAQPHKVEFLDHINDPTAMRSFYSNLDIFVMLSKKEGLSLAMLEAMASGAPSLILSPWGDDVIQDGVNGINLNSDEPEAVAEELLKLILAPNRRIQIGINGVQSVMLNNAPSVIAERVTSFYRTVLS